jgi:hypothetical protein
MKRLFLCCLLCGLVLINAIGCESKSSSLEGRVLDGKGRTLANVKVAARMLQSVRGYEKFEAVTGSDGIFRFGKLYPESEYQLNFYSDRWTSDKKITANSGPEEQTRILPEPVTIRFMVSGERVLIDTLKDLEWFEGPDKDTNWEQAQSWVAGLQIAGGGWRIPIRAELTSLITVGSGKLNIHPFLTFRGKYIFVWSMKQGDPSSAWAFPFILGAGPGIILDESKSKRVLAVRSRKQ